MTANPETVARAAGDRAATARILVVDEQPVVRHGVRLILECRPGFEVAGETGDGRAAVELAGVLRPDVVVMEAAVPRLNGVDAIAGIREAAPATAVVLFTGGCALSTARAALRAGAHGYVLKVEAPDVLVAAVEDALLRRTYVSPRAMQLVLGPGAAPAGPGREPPPDVFELLTVREREVLQLMAEGKETKEIAWELAVSVKTVQGHRMTLINRLGITSVAQLTKFAIRVGLTTAHG